MVPNLLIFLQSPYKKKLLKLVSFYLPDIYVVDFVFNYFLDIFSAFSFRKI